MRARASKTVCFATDREGSILALETSLHCTHSYGPKSNCCYFRTRFFVFGRVAHRKRGQKRAKSHGDGLQTVTSKPACRRGSRTLHIRALTRHRLLLYSLFQTIQYLDTTFGITHHTMRKIAANTPHTMKYAV